MTIDQFKKYIKDFRATFDLTKNVLEIEEQRAIDLAKYDSRLSAMILEHYSKMKEINEYIISRTERN